MYLLFCTTCLDLFSFYSTYYSIWLFESNLLGYESQLLAMSARCSLSVATEEVMKMSDEWRELRWPFDRSRYLCFLSPLPTCPRDARPLLEYKLFGRKSVGTPLCRHHPPPTHSMIKYGHLHFLPLPNLNWSTVHQRRCRLIIYVV